MGLATPVSSAVETSHRMIVLSTLPEASVWLHRSAFASGGLSHSGLKAKLFTEPKCSNKGQPMGWRLATSHRMMVWSSLPEASVLPSELKATLHTSLECPVKGWPMD